MVGRLRASVANWPRARGLCRKKSPLVPGTFCNSQGRERRCGEHTGQAEFPAEKSPDMNL